MIKQPFFNPNRNSQKPIAIVTGGAGFIGSYLCELLLGKSCHVIAIDNLLTGDKENLANCFAHPEFTFLKHDLAKDLDGLEQANYIFHLAGLNVYENEKERNQKILEVNVKGTTQLLKLAHRTQARFLYCSLFTFENEKQLTDDLSNDITFNNFEQNKPQSLSESQLFAERLVFRQHRENRLNIRVVRLGDVYGPRMNLETVGEVQKLLRQAVKGKSLIVVDSEREIYPSFVADAVYGISKAMFGSNTNGKVFNLINPRVISIKEFAQQVKEQSPKSLNIKLKFKRSFEKHLSVKKDLSWEKIKKNQVNFGWDAKIGAREGIKLTLDFWERKNLSGKRFNFKLPFLRGKGESLRKTTREDSGNFCQKSKSLIIFIFFLFLVIFYPLISVGWGSFLGINNLKSAQKSFMKADFQKAEKKFQSAKRNFSHTKKRVQNYMFFFEWLGQERMGVRIEKAYGIGENLSQSAAHACAGFEMAIQVGQTILQNKTGDLEVLLRETKADFDLAYERFSFAKAESQTEKKLLPIEIPYEEIDSLFLKAKKTTEILPQLVGVGKGERRVYLVLLQNNMELRPTGGFIGSFALVTFYEGRLIDFEVQDVYSADGQLKGHVEPPPELKKYLGEANWYLRDSNWHPDFPTTASRTEWFLEKEIGRTVDGVIGLNLFTAQNILSQIGEIELLDFQEKINSQNLFERAEYHSEFNFFPGSTQKKDFLSALSQTLFDQIKKSDKETWFSIGKAFYLSLREKDILIYLNNPEAMGLISELDFDGRIKTITCRSSQVNCFLDYLMIVEANVGVNKANYFMQRNLSHQVKINQEGVFEEILQIRYQNQSQSEVFPEGRYKNYLRVLLPDGTFLDEVTIEGKKIEETKIDRQKIGDKQSFGFLVEVPIKEQMTVEVHYRLSNRIDFKYPAKYLFLLQKQSGIRDKVFNFQMEVPSGLSTFEAKPSAKQSQNTLLFSSEFNQDLVFEVGITR